MKSVALHLVAGIANHNEALNLLREYLQAFVLRSLYESEAFSSLAFVGGTALRFLHNLPRFSEDLDFSVTDSKAYDGRGWLSKVKRDLELAGFKPEVTWNDRKTVHVGWVRLEGILYEAGLASQPRQKLAIKVEIDTCPPAGALYERRVLTRHLTFFVQYYDLPSLLAGKTHALLTRKYVKGRDWYDLLWYSSLRPPLLPNVGLLQNALDQTQGQGKIDAAKWRELLAQKVARLDFESVRDDVGPFLEYPREAALLTHEAFEVLLEAH